MDDFVRVDYGNKVATITIDQPSSLNALSSSILHSLDSAISDICNNGDTRVIIFTGAGRSFVAGADISEMVNLTTEEAYDYALLGARLFHRIESLHMVTIAAVNGYALGGGCELAMACDIRVASEKAQFGQPEVSLGIIPGFSGIRRMIETVGEAKAKEYIFSGRVFDAQEAERVGLVNKVISADFLMDECQKMAEDIASKSFNAVIASKKVMNALKESLDEKVRCQSEGFANCFKHKDQKIGMCAFLNKEKPSF